MPLRLGHHSVGHRALQVAAVVIVAAIVWWIPHATLANGKPNNGLISDMINAYMLMIAAMSLNLVLGYTGMISLGHSAFFGVGAYATGIAVTRWGWSPLWTFFLGFAVAAVIGAIVSLPALRIKGIYLALVTLAVALVFPALMKWRKLVWLTGGAKGMQQTSFDPKMRTFRIFGIDFFGNLRGIDGRTVFYYWIALVLVVITYVVCRGIVHSRVGRALVAIRDNETAAAVMGVNLAATKALVFGVSAGLCSLAGSLSTIRTSVLSPDSPNNTLLGAIVFLVVMVIGGTGTLWGPIVGALAYTWISSVTSDWADDAKIPGLLRPLLGWTKLSPSTGVFAAVLIIGMFVAPFGIVGLLKRFAARLIVVAPAPIGTGSLATVQDHAASPTDAPRDTNSLEHTNQGDSTNATT